MTENDYLELADLLYPNVKEIEYYLNKYKPRNKDGEVTRVAPSPTGYLHIGTVFQALVDTMIAGKDGVFILRIEDTDSKREVAEAGQIAYDTLCAYGLKPQEGYRAKYGDSGDYGPYLQSQRIEIYHAFAHELVKRGRAFPCFCKVTNSKQEVLQKREEELEQNDGLAVKDACRNLTLEEIKKKLEEGQSFALRLKSLGEGIKTRTFTDEILGTKELRENSKDDILIKTNGVPVYSLAHIVDDTLMRTTVMVRGQDWYQSLPVHVELSEAFGFKPFRYAHTPNICVLDEETGNKRKISKRKDSFADARIFLKKGYPVEAILEYLLNLLNSDFEPWRKNNPDLSYTEFPFAMNKIGVTNPMFDFMKLNDISKTIISKYSTEKVYEELKKWANEWDKDAEKIIVENEEVLKKALSIDRGGVRPRKDITFMSEVLELYNYVLPNFKPKYKISPDNVDLGMMRLFLNDYQMFYKELEDNQAWFEDLKAKSLEYKFVDNKTYKQNPEMYSGSIADTSKYIRLAITGRENSPELYSIMKILGVEECQKRIKNFMEDLKDLDAI